VEAFDVDGDDLSYGLSSAPNWLILADITLSGIPGNDDVGDHAVSITISDGELVVNQSFTLTVHDINDPPSVEDINVSLAEDSTMSIILTGSDPDGDTLSFIIGTDPENG
jgi:hypothetical protein